MRANWNIIKLLIFLVILGVLYGFGNLRNNGRNLTDLDIDFIDENQPFVTLAAVNKLLIQNNDSVTSMHKETLVLNEMEQRLLEHSMVRNAEVFVTVDGELSARIEQRKPMARIAGSPHYYLDEDGKKMPLSTVYSARVPLVTGTSKTGFSELTPLLRKLQNDAFMKQTVVGLHVKVNGNIELRLRKHNLKVLFGKPKDIDRKFQNFKAFYQQTKKDNLLTGYSLVNLQFGNQVVATKR